MTSVTYSASITQSYKTLKFSVSVPCLMAVGVGTALAWTSPVLPQLYKEGSWLVITKEQGSWVSSLLALGAIAGAVPSAPMADKLGRKKTLLLLAAPFLLSWVIIIFASKLWLIMLARFIVGAAVGAACVVVPTYISEIAETSTRGTLGAMFQLNITIGILLAFVLGAFMNYTAFAIVCALVEVGFLASFIWMPESPIWLVNQRRKPEAMIAMTVLRGDSYDPSEELAEAQREAEEVASRNSSIFDLVRTPAARRALLASLGAMFFQQLSGINAVIFYTVTIFQASGSSIHPDVASIIVAVVQMIMTSVAALIVDRAGRKPLLIFSSSVMLVSLLALGAYFNIQASKSDVSNLGWLPLTSLTLFMISFSVGMGPIPWMLMGELFPAETKAIASGIAVMLNWFLVFLVTKTFPAMNEGLGADITFWIFAAIMAVSTGFTYFLIPETKGKTSQQIQEELQGNVRSTRTDA
ncbi:PREDICTED: facilitated trehalose transporter Tret1-like isoform X2 [Vollenhovia emeryi]|uniref:facilitated trehalose transporter Tret1-like isoform X2 n=1 Tax=Vollenhovia emeryi TaxID=411798 RepID=UPI0005F3D198|nr:PREDICTED: facilitated trehalose transporter Tret1-like isoform X2 [Vollenhovia emeryi]